MSIVDKAASKRGGGGRSSLVERAMSRQGRQADAAPVAERSPPEPASPASASPPSASPESATPDSRRASATPAGSASARAAEGPPAAVHSVPERPGAGRRRSTEPKVSQRFRLDWEDLERHRMIGTSRHARRLQSEIRTIKSRLMSSLQFFDFKRGARGRGGENLVLVTSARQGEGKSFTAINLALSLALEDRIQVLLVDADAVRCSVTDFFKLGRQRKGLHDRLRDPGLDLSEVLLRAEGTSLSVLPVGQLGQETTELYAGPVMTRLLDELSNRYPDRLVIFDAPPMLAANEPVVLSKQIQQVLLVVEAGKTTEATIHTALDVLGQRDRVRLVLNHCTIKGDEVQSTSYGYGQERVQDKSPPPRGQEAA